ncbi:Metacaspase-7 Short=AtMC7 [Rhizoctonia solani AG-1 IB]|uniref:Metacaspase-7 Short=AtMC7 n=2 Tax=Thanatephorus cucumeris (strain AG1-IB / isolate 7/3/14) TaxID=1108050 RepID=M5CCP4_THACB|nr:Metacaspase-7 Short=AtMC7 [Rhizoctonia solani AG-1 IB]
MTCKANIPVTSGGDPMSIVQGLKTGGRSSEKPIKQSQMAGFVINTGTKSKPPLHALVIGINKYKTSSNLVAAVPDALAFKAYLTDDLSVPEKQITVLLDEQAKRANIIKAFQRLARPDNGIKRDDPIVIYYAGHGSEIDPPPDRAANGPLIQCIIPHDASKDTEVVPIPDFTIATLVHQIAREKGNNITLIFDCCHSASGSRCNPEGARFIDKAYLPKLPRSPDKEVIQDALMGSRDVIDPSLFRLSFDGMDSHVLLAACGHGEIAFEDRVEKYGYFSNALLKILRTVGVDALTYKGCIQRMSALQAAKPQNPGANASYIVIKPKGSDFYLQAGLVQGITPGSKYTIHASDVSGPSNPSLGTLEVERVEASESRLKGANTLGLSKICYGRQIAYGRNQPLDIYVTQEFVNAAEPSDTWAPVFSGGVSGLVLRPVDPALASVILSVSPRKEVTFTLTNQDSIKYGFDKFPSPGYEPAPPSALYVIPILTALSRWYCHLHRTPHHQTFRKSIDFEFYKLQFIEEFTEEGSPILVPEGENRNVGGVVDIVANPDNCYGVKVVNRSRQDLYAYLIDFCATSLSISQKTIPVAGLSSYDQTLPQNTPLTIGYGSGGQIPFIFAVNEGRNMDVNYLKLFVSTRPIDFEPIVQESPFEGRSAVLDKDTSDVFGNGLLWDTFTMTVVQRRHPLKGKSPPQPNH